MDNAFGLSDGPETDDVDPFANSPVVGETEPEEEVTTTEVEVETDVPVSSEVVGDERAVEEPEEPKDPKEPEVEAEEPETAEDETPAEEAERLFAGKYKSAEELERGYSELSTRQREIAQENAQLTEYLRVAAQVIQERQQAPAAQAPDEAALAKLADEHGVDVETLKLAQSIAQEQTTQAVAPIQQQLQAQQQEAQQRQAYEAQLRETFGVIAEFKQANPIDAATENTMFEVFTKLNLDESDPVMYEVALEAARDSALFITLAANPAWVETEEGMQLARVNARQLASGNGPTQKAASRNTPAARQRAHVESGGTGAAPEAQEAAPKPWDVLELAQKERKAESVFGV